MPAKAAGILDQVSGYWVAMAGRGIQQEKKKKMSRNTSGMCFVDSAWCTVRSAASLPCCT